MKIAVIGSGQIGSGVGALLAEAGHPVRFAARDDARARAVADRIGRGAGTTTVGEAAGWAEAVLVAVPGPAVPDVISELAAPEGTVLLDAANFPPADAAAVTAAHPDLHLARVFNTLQADVYGRPAEQRRSLAVFVSGDQPAVAVAMELVHDAGFVPVVTGGLDRAPLQEIGGPLFDRELDEAAARAALTAAVAGEASGVDDAFLFGQLSQMVFSAGLSWQLVRSKWPAFRRDFHEFDPAVVAALPPEEVARIEADPDIVRNRRKIEATVRNAQVIVDLSQQHGSLREWLASFADPAAAIRAVDEEFEFIGPQSARYLVDLAIGRSTDSAVTPPAAHTG